MLNVKEYGAQGDGKADETRALQQCIDRCGVLGGGEVFLPAGNYSTHALALRSHVTLHLAAGTSLLGSADLSRFPLTQVRWEGRWIEGYSALISATDCEQIAIEGPGRIVGNPEIRGRIERATGRRLPALIEFTRCRNLRVENCDTSNGGMWSIHPVNCESALFKNLVVESGADGIDVDSCRRVTIEDCRFHTADDCISLKSGRGMEGNTLAQPTEEVRIARCSFYDSHFACIGIGSETSAGIRGVRIEDCVCTGARSHALYIKSRPGRGAFIEDIFVDGFEATGAQLGFLRLNMLNSGKQDEFPVPGTQGLPTVRNFHFKRIRVHDLPALVEGWALDPRKPLDGFSLADVEGTAKRGIVLAHVRNAKLSGIHLSGYEGPLLRIEDVTGEGLDGAAPLAENTSPELETVPSPATPYKLH